MNKPIVFAASAAMSVALLGGCGNKGPLVRPADIPPPVDAMPADAPATDATAIDATATDEAEVPAAAGDAATTPPPPAQDDGD
jgi:predicted small lipoprotein YifL